MIFCCFIYSCYESRKFKNLGREGVVARVREAVGGEGDEGGGRIIAVCVVVVVVVVVVDEVDGDEDLVLVGLGRLVLLRVEVVVVRRALVAHLEEREDAVRGRDLVAMKWKVNDKLK